MKKIIEKESIAKKEKTGNDKIGMLCLRDEKHMSFSWCVPSQEQNHDF